MKSRIVITCMALITAMAALTACGGKEEAKSKGKTKIRFATWDVAEDIKLQQGLVDKFNESHDDVEVVLEAYGDEFDTKITAGMGSGDAPDVMYMWNYPAYYQGLEPLDAYIEKEGEEFKADYYEALWDYNSLDGSIYGMPVGFTTHALYYNKDLFAQAGVEQPQETWTWQDLQKAARTISEKTGVRGFSFQMKPDPYDYEMYLWSNQTSYCDAEGNMDGYLNSKKAKDVFKMFQEMEKDGYAVATEKSGTDEFRAGTSAMYIYGSWAIKSLKKDGVNFGIAKLPSMDTNKSVSILSSSGLSISKDSNHKEEAWEFVKYWTGAQCNKDRIGTELPVLNSVVSKEGIMKDPMYAPFYQMLDQSAGHTPASFIMDNWSEVSEGLSLAFETIYNPSSYGDISDVLEEEVKK